MKDTDVNRIDCFQCVYFAVSWNPTFPKACKLYGFKSASMPSLTVFRSSGSECLGFVQKEFKNKHNT